MYLLYFFKKTLKSCFYFFKSLFIYLPNFFVQYFQLKKQKSERFPIQLKNIHPCLTDASKSTPFDQHYTYHPAWAARVLQQLNPTLHVDVSSILSFSSIVSAFVPTKFYDYRPAKLVLQNFESDFIDLKKMHFADNAIESISCMHTIEHIGLGRYGDALDINGDITAINELQRVTAVGGTIIFVTPVGKPTLAFNAHRIYSYQQIISYFNKCTVSEFSLIPDEGGLLLNADHNLVALQNYGCGCFVFKKTN